MKVISAKELRTNLDSIFEDVLQGKSIVVKHRFKDPIELRVHKPKAKIRNKPNTTPGLTALDNAVKKPHNLDPNKSIKQLYHEELDKRYKT